MCELLRIRFLKSNYICRRLVNRKSTNSEEGEKSERAVNNFLAQIKRKTSVEIFLLLIEIKYKNLNDLLQFLLHQIFHSNKKSLSC